ncbi:MAG: 16S rRNA (cytosine(1402)-N(4))-methyltransferase RsmH [Candidatus Jorgensenbacteria bacterium]|nr:16S rRNA (cytosine(1402)-N(4))-methyltransferase RsmH [Candidatus Jorgensenbacteria bacterium]
MHAPVLLEETIAALALKEGDFAVDGTLGSGGHAEAILRRIGALGRLLGVEWDEHALMRARTRLASPAGLRPRENPRNTIFVHGSYADLPSILAREKLPKADALLLDLGFSSDQLEESGRGFSFLRDEPLDMRYDTREGETAAELIARASVTDLARIFREYGEERQAEKFAGAVTAAKRRGPIRTSGALAKVITDAVGGRGRIHPATKVFMALRIAVNHEFENIRTVLERLPEVVRAGGRVAVITFHSLEDRVVKKTFRALAKEGIVRILTKHVVKPSRAEVLANPRSRSAKLRALQIL